MADAKSENGGSSFACTCSSWNRCDFFTVSANVAMNGDASSAATKIANAVNASERIASRRDTARSANAIQSANRPPKNVTCVTVSGWPPYNITVQTMTANTNRRYVRCSISSSMARNANGSQTATVTIGKCSQVMTNVQNAKAMAPIADGSSS